MSGGGFIVHDLCCYLCLSPMGAQRLNVNRVHTKPGLSVAHVHHTCWPAVTVHMPVPSQCAPLHLSA
jgi:hypothetical protein